MRAGKQQGNKLTSIHAFPSLRRPLLAAPALTPISDMNAYKSGKTSQLKHGVHKLPGHCAGPVYSRPMGAPRLSGMYVNNSMLSIGGIGFNLSLRLRARR